MQNGEQLAYGELIPTARSQTALARTARNVYAGDWRSFFTTATVFYLNFTCDLAETKMPPGGFYGISKFGVAKCGAGNWHGWRKVKHSYDVAMAGSGVDVGDLPNLGKVSPRIDSRPL